MTEAGVCPVLSELTGRWQRPWLMSRGGFQRLAAAFAVASAPQTEPVRVNANASPRRENPRCPSSRRDSPPNDSLPRDSGGLHPGSGVRCSLPLREGLPCIPIHGVLTPRGSMLDGLLPITCYETVQQQLHEAAEAAAHQSDPRTLVLDIDSPGGEVSGLFALCEQIHALRSHANLQLIAHVNESAFSAAYAIAAATGRVILGPTAGVGSIGVITAHVDQSGFDAKQGLQYTFISAGEYKNAGNPHAPLSEDARAQYQQEVNAIYALLIDHVARYRGTPPALIRQTQARCFYGQAAVDQQLADTLLPFSADLPTLIGATQGAHSTLTLTQRSSTPMSTPLEKTDHSCEITPTTATPAAETAVKTSVAAATPPAKPPAAAAVSPTLADHSASREELLALCQLCEVTRRTDKLADFIRQDIRLEAAKDVLLAELTEQWHSPEQAIRHQHLPDGVSSAASRAAVRRATPDQEEETLVSLARARAQSQSRPASGEPSRASLKPARNG